VNPDPAVAVASTRPSWPGVGVLVIGDELLSGRRQDRHLAAVIQRLAPLGLQPAYAEYVGDDAARIEAALRRARAEAAVLFSFGGIGATPDDLTRACAASAWGRALVRHPGAVALIEARFGEAAYPQRIRMAELPEGCELIPNPVNQVPGFSLHGEDGAAQYFFPGFPEMAHVMLDWVLEYRYRSWVDRPRDYQEASVRVIGAAESQLIELMETIVRDHPQLKLFSLPRLGPGDRREVELGLKGTAREVADGMQTLRAALAEAGFEFVEQPVPG